MKRSRRGTLGYHGYVLPALRVLWRYRAPALRVTVDEHPPVSGGLVMVSNTRNYGGIFVVTARAAPDSGHLDICVLRRASLPYLARFALAALNGRALELPGVTLLTGRRVRIVGFGSRYLLAVYDPERGYRAVN